MKSSLLNLQNLCFLATLLASCFDGKFDIKVSNCPSGFERVGTLGCRASTTASKTLGAFKITAPLEGEEMTNTNPTVKWELSSAADHFDLVISTSKDCSTTSRSFKNVKTGIFQSK